MMQPIKALLESRYVTIGAFAFQLWVTVMMLIPSSGFTNLEVPYFDKIAHTGIYAASLLLWVFVFFKKIPNKGTLLGVVFLSLLFYGMVIEFVQGNWVPDRTFDPWDVLANIVGMMIGMVVFYIIRPVWPSKK